MDTRAYLLPVSIVVLAGAILAGLGDVANAIRYGSEMLPVGAILVLGSGLVFGWLLFTSIRAQREKGREEDRDQDH